MRDPNRIDAFMALLTQYWKDLCPDWRFGQLICNLQSFAGNDLFYMEEADFKKLLERFFIGSDM